MSTLRGLFLTRRVAVETDKGRIECDYVVIGAGPWVNEFWNMLELPKSVSIKMLDGTIVNDVPMWRFWQLEEGVLDVEPGYLMTDAGKMPPVIHIDTDAPLYSQTSAELISDGLWGIYYKPDFHFRGIQGGAMPYKINIPADEVRLDPYGPESPEFVASIEFADMWTSALAFCHKRFEGKQVNYRNEKSGGLWLFYPGFVSGF